MDKDTSKEMLYKTLAGFVGVATIVLIYAVFLGPVGRYTNSLMSPRTINISASDKVNVKPDTASISFSVVTENVNLSVAQEENNKKMNESIAMLKQQGIVEDDIKTTEYNIYPVYSQYVTPMYSGISSEFVPKIIKYSMTQTVSAKVRDFSKISTILDALPKMGINKIGNISFIVDDMEKGLAQARAKAFQKAQDKAKSISEQNGIKLGRIINVSDYQDGGYNQYRDAVGGYGGDMMLSSVKSIAPVIQPGTQEISVNVNITYEIK